MDQSPITASEINVVDKNGKVRIRLFVDEENDCQVVLSDANGTERLDALVTEDGIAQYFLRELNGDGNNHVLAKLQR